MSSVSNLGAVGILQREWGVTNGWSKTPVIGTESVGPCVAMTVWNPAYRDAALVHFDNRTATMENVDSVFKEMASILPRGSELQVSFIGGWKGGGTRIQKMAEQIPSLSKNYPCKVDASKLFSLPKGRGYAYVAIDARSGSVTASFDEPKFENDRELEERGKTLGVSLRGELFKNLGPLELVQSVSSREAIVIPRSPETIKLVQELTQRK